MLKFMHFDSRWTNVDGKKSFSLMCILYVGSIIKEGKKKELKETWKELLGGMHEWSGMWWKDLTCTIG